ncbi:hypothetical protein GUITHDRAFT_135994 [Guillardia theta CCMP2712]|uniref:Sfi1 spindle body domain-containing protein n=1 Tax=Guillardia theta (strain CCMP2712) TaxID=905079 RepID=L1JML8_GUITC|nr:hypothetical protein GUITHDRAFT_135994 [Guillardia theta CCMP2712]EKX49303.1 hypothetical protein GUITHDRAFT_135994 [Guillardia theta CCMP2712]|eukprot:XP_005836283.1 hypothetical protein GUITHDRAFT_135994 [Guillardia theta CCMP2712]
MSDENFMQEEEERMRDKLVEEQEEKIGVNGTHQVEQTFEFRRKLSVMKERELEEMERKHVEILSALQHENDMLRNQVKDQSNIAKQLENQVQELKLSISYSVSLDALREYEELIANERVNSWLMTLNNIAKHWTRLNTSRCFWFWFNHAMWKKRNLWCVRRVSRARLHAWLRKFKNVMTMKRVVKSDTRKAQWLKIMHQRRRCRLQFKRWMKQFIKDMFHLWSEQNTRCKYFQQTMQLQETVKLYESEIEAIMTRLHEVETDLEYERSKNLLEYREQAIVKEREIERIEQNCAEKLSAHLEEIKILEAVNKNLTERNKELESEGSNRKLSLVKDRPIDVCVPDAAQDTKVMHEMSIHLSITIYKARMTKRIVFDSFRSLTGSPKARMGDFLSSLLDRRTRQLAFQCWSTARNLSRNLLVKATRCKSKSCDRTLLVALQDWRGLCRAKRREEGKIMRVRRRNCEKVLRWSFEKWNEEPESICEMRSQLVRKEAEVAERTRDLQESNSKYDAMLLSRRREMDRMRQAAGSLGFHAQKKVPLLRAMTSWRLQGMLKFLFSCVKLKAAAMGRRSVSRRALHAWAWEALGENEEEQRRQQDGPVQMTPKEQLRAARRMVTSWERLQRKIFFKQTFLGGSFIRWINELALRAFSEWRQGLNSSLTRRRVNLGGYV